jgi:hypothetical protein
VSEELEGHVTTLQASISELKGIHSLLQNTGLPKLQATMPLFLEQCNEASMKKRILIALLQQALDEHTLEVLPALNKNIMVQPPLLLH